MLLAIIQFLMELRNAWEQESTHILYEYRGLEDIHCKACSLIVMGSIEL